jgi:hypothetical protein
LIAIPDLFKQLLKNHRLVKVLNVPLKNNGPFLLRKNLKKLSFLILLNLLYNFDHLSVSIESLIMVKKEEIISGLFLLFVNLLEKSLRNKLKAIRERKYLQSVGNVGKTKS